MRETQKVIKYVAMAFGIFLSINIIYWSLFAITSVFGLVAHVEDKGEISTVTYSQEFTNVENIEIDMSVSKLNIKKGDKLKVEGANLSEEFKAKTENGTLTIEDKNIGTNFLFSGEDTSEITVYIPNELKSAKITTGISKSDIENLKVKSLDLKLGVGKNYIKDLTAQDTKIECGAGKVEIEDANLNDVDLSTGVGSFDFRGKITGNSKIECGIGKTDLRLKGSENDYKITTKTGLGAFSINGNSASNEGTYGNGNSTIKVTGGIGKVDIDFEN